MACLEMEARWINNIEHLVPRLVGNLCVVACLRPAHNEMAHLLINSRLGDHRCKSKGRAIQILSHTTQLLIGLA